MTPAFMNILILAGLTLATPLVSPRVSELKKDAFEEAQQRDATATRPFSNVQIRSSDGRCLSVDILSGDFRANLTPVQLAECGSTQGQGWDIITSGVHNNQPGQMLVVSTLTQACLNFDPRRSAGNQVLLFSCGGRADGGGEVTTSQLFAFDGSAGPLTLSPSNAKGQCLTSKGNTLDIAACKNEADDQSFTIGDAPTDGSSDGDGATQGLAETLVTSTSAVQETAPLETPAQSTPLMTAAPRPVRTRTRKSKKPKKTRKSGCNTSSAPPSGITQAASSSVPDAITVTATGGNKETSITNVASSLASGTATERVPVSRAGGFLNPSAAAEAQQFDKTATRLIESVNIRAPDGRCLFVNPMAGDFRENLIPIELKKCTEDPNQKFDLISKGKHNNGDAGRVLLVSVLMNGCISFDNRRPEGDKVTMFSCGGRAAGEGETDNAQLFAFTEDDIPDNPAVTMNIRLDPLSGNGQFCLIAGKDRLEAAACNNSASQVFEVVEVL